MANKLDDLSVGVTFFIADYILLSPAFYYDLLPNKEPSFNGVSFTFVLIFKFISSFFFSVFCKIDFGFDGPFYSAI